MLREVVYQGLRTRRIRPTWLLQSSRSLADQPFRQELDRLLKVLATRYGCSPAQPAGSRCA
jgi:hypothetical protein